MYCKVSQGESEYQSVYHANPVHIDCIEVASFADIRQHNVVKNRDPRVNLSIGDNNYPSAQHPP